MEYGRLVDPSTYTVSYGLALTTVVVVVVLGPDAVALAGF